MFKYLIPLLSLLLTTSTLISKDLSKEEKKRIKTQLKEFEKDPESYQRMIDKYKETIDANAADIAQRKTSIQQLSTSLIDAEAKITEAKTQLKDCQDRPTAKCPECPIAGEVPPGVVYKVQVGLFKKFDMNKYFTEAKYMGVERDDKMNRYVISYFNTKEEAESLVADLRRLGLKGAFSAKYENGERAVEHKTQNQPKTKSESKPKDLLHMPTK